MPEQFSYQPLPSEISTQSLSPGVTAITREPRIVVMSPFELPHQTTNVLPFQHRLITEQRQKPSSLEDEFQQKLNRKYEVDENGILTLYGLVKVDDGHAAEKTGETQVLDLAFDISSLSLETNTREYQQLIKHAKAYGVAMPNGHADLPRFLYDMLVVDQAFASDLTTLQHFFGDDEEEFAKFTSASAQGPIKTSDGCSEITAQDGDGLHFHDIWEGYDKGRFLTTLALLGHERAQPTLLKLTEERQPKRYAELGNKTLQEIPEKDRILALSELMTQRKAKEPKEVKEMNWEERFDNLAVSVLSLSDTKNPKSPEQQAALERYVSNEIMGFASFETPPNEDEKKFNFEQTQIFQNLLKKYRQQFTTIPTEAIATVLMRVHKSIPTPEQQQLLLTRLKSLSMGEALSFAQNLKPEDIAMLLSYDMAFSTQASTPEADKNPLQQVITTIAGYLHRDKGLWYVNYRSAQAGEHGKGFHGTIGKSGMGECCSSASANGAAAAAGAAARGSLGGASGGSGGGGGGSNGGFGGGITTHAAMTRAEAFSGEKQKSSSSSIQTKSAARTAERASQKNSSEGHVIPFPAVWENRRESVAIRTAPITSIKRETAVPLQASKTRPIAKAALGVIRPTRQEIPQPARVARTPDRSTSPAKHLRTEPRPQVRKITKHPESPRVIQRKQRAPESIHTLRTERISSPARHRTGRETISGKVKTKEQFLAPISALPAPERRATPPPARHIEIGSKLRTALQHFDRAVNTGSTQTQHNTAISERSSQLAQALQKASRTQQEVTASDTHTATTTQEQTVTAATNQQTKQENQAQTAPASEATQQTETASGSTQEQSKSAERTDSQHATTETTQTTVETPSEAIKETSEARSENTKTQSEEFAPATVAAEKKQAEVQTPGAEKTTTTQMAERQTEASSQVAQSKSETVSQTTEAVTNHDQQQVEAAATSENHELAGEADITQVAKDTAMTTTIHAESAPAQEDESGIVESNQSPEVSEIGTHEVRQLQQKAAAKKATGEATDHFVTAQVSSHANAEAGVMLDPSVLDMSNPYGMTSDIRFFLNSLARQLA